MNDEKSCSMTKPVIHVLPNANNKGTDLCSLVCNFGMPSLDGKL